MRARCGLALTAAVSAGTCPNHASLGPDQKANWVKGLEAALKKFEIPKIIDPYTPTLCASADYAPTVGVHSVALCTE